jgi:glucose-1-phosphate adenylyltransferase
MFLTFGEGKRVRDMGVYTEGSDCCFLDSLIIGTDLMLNLLNWYEAMPYMDLMEVIIENLGKLRVGSYEFQGYVGAANGIRAYMDINMDVLKTEVREELFRSDRSISTKVQDYTPVKYLKGAKVRNALIPTGCIIGGTVENSVLSRGVTVSQGAVIRNCVILQRCVIGRGAELENVIADKFAVVHDGVRLAGTRENPIVIRKYQEI